MKFTIATDSTVYKISIHPHDPVPRVGELISIDGKTFKVTHVVHDYQVDLEWKERHGVNLHYLNEVKISVSKNF